jgi:hypothetical protein
MVLVPTSSSLLTSSSSRLLHTQIPGSHSQHASQIGKYPAGKDCVNTSHEVTDAATVTVKGYLSPGGKRRRFIAASFSFLCTPGRTCSSQVPGVSCRA